MLLRRLSTWCGWRRLISSKDINSKVFQNAGRQEIQQIDKFTTPVLIFRPKRHFRVSPISLYEDADVGSENVARRNIPNVLFIRNHPAYRDLFFHYDLHQIETEITHPAVKSFIAIARSSPDEHLFHDKYKVEVDALIASLQELTEIELQYALFHLRLFSNPRDKLGKAKYAKIWMPFDDECLRRGVERKKWRAPISFVYANLWDLLLLGRQSTFHWIVIKTCFRKVDTLSREKFVRMCQSICRARKLPKDLKLYNLEYNITRLMEDSERNGRPITMEELSAICTVFYKMKYPLQTAQIVIDILNVCMENSKTISNASVTAIFSGLCISSRLRIEDTVAKLLNAMLPEVYRLDLNACAALLLFACRNRVRNTKFVSAIADRLEAEKNNINAKDLDITHIDWLARSFEDLDHPSSPAFKTIFTIMENLALAIQAKSSFRDVRMNDEDSDEDEASSESTDLKDEHLHDLIAKIFQKRLIPILNHLAYGGVYPRSLILKALSSEYLNTTYGKSMYTYPMEILRLDQEVAPELSDYTGQRLSEKVLGFLTKSCMTWVPDPKHQKVYGFEGFATNVFEMTRGILGDPSHAYFCNVVPHFGTLDVVFCTTKSGQIVPVPESFKGKKEYQPKILTPEDLDGGDLQYHAIITYSLDKLIYGTDEPLGRFSILEGKAEKMGYKIYKISYNSWRNKSREDCQSLLRTVLQDVLVKIPKSETEKESGRLSQVE